MPRPKKDPNTSTASYNIKNVERAIGFATALINNEYPHHKSLASAAEQYTLSSLESAMVYVETVNLIAPQFRDGQEIETIATEFKHVVATYTLAEIEATKTEVKSEVNGTKQRRVAAKQ